MILLKLNQYIQTDKSALLLNLVMVSPSCCKQPRSNGSGGRVDGYVTQQQREGRLKADAFLAKPHPRFSVQLEIGDGLKAVHAITAGVSTPNGALPGGSGGSTSPEDHQVDSIRSSDDSSPASRESERKGVSNGNGTSEGARDRRLDVLFIDVDAGDARWAVFSGPKSAFGIGVSRLRQAPIADFNVEKQGLSFHSSGPFSAVVALCCTWIMESSSCRLCFCWYGSDTSWSESGSPSVL